VSQIRPEERVPSKRRPVWAREVPTAVWPPGSTRRSAPHGPCEAVRRRATSLGERLKPGCDACSPTRPPERCLAWSAPARPSPTQVRSTSATSSRTASASASTLRDYDSIFRNHVVPHLMPERVEHWAAHEIDPDRRLRPGRSDLPHRRVHGSPPRRTHRTSLARRRLPRINDPGPSELHGRPPDVPEVRPRSAPSRWHPKSPRLSHASASAAAARSASTPSAPASSASPTSAASKSEWATPTSRERCNTSTTSHARRTRPCSVRRSPPISRA
jgi:hypothetical protein